MTESTNILIPRTPAEKLEVLTKARAIVDTNFGQSAWVKVVNETAQYCLYGAVECAMGYDLEGELRETIELEKALGGDEGAEYWKDALEDPEDYGFGPSSKYDRVVNECSLTTTMYDAAIRSGTVRDSIFIQRINAAEAREKEAIRATFSCYPPDIDTDARFDEYIDFNLMTWKTSVLQSLNDDQGREAVLKVLDEAIEGLKAEVAAG